MAVARHEAYLQLEEYLSGHPLDSRYDDVWVDDFIGRNVS